MTGIEAINKLMTQDSYKVSEIPEGYSISWHGNNPVSFTTQEIETMDLPSIERKSHNGRNVRHITRVTGYMSYTESWNPGKKSELTDRHRTPIT